MKDKTSQLMLSWAASRCWGEGRFERLAWVEEVEVLEDMVVW